MHDSMLAKLEKLKERLSEIEALLIDSETIKDMDNYTLLNKEFAEPAPESNIPYRTFCDT